MEKRDVMPFFVLLRELLSGRKYKWQLRFIDMVSTKSPPLPRIPDGPMHRIAENYYYKRDVMRYVKPPENVHSPHKSLEPKVDSQKMAARKKSNWCSNQGRADVKFPKPKW